MTSADVPADSAPASSASASQPNSSANGTDQAAGTPRRSIGLSAAGLVAVSVLLWIVVAAVTVLAWRLPEHMTFADEQRRTIISALFFLPSVILGVYAGALTIVGAVRWAVYGPGARGVANQDQGEVVNLLKTMSQRLLVSETAKRIAFRGEDIQVLRQTIQQDIDKEQYDAALVLVQELAHTYGHVEEAETYREKILQARDAKVDAKITQAEREIDALLAKHDFESAHQTASRLQRVHGEHSSRPRLIVQKVIAAREQYKQDLEREFLTAAKREDVDRAMELLKELDKYLTEREAEPFRETARGVIGQQRDNLGVQFKLAVQDKEWVRANAIGEQIIREFPNTRMADEVRGMLDLLRERAAGQNAAASRQPG